MKTVKSSAFRKSVSAMAITALVAGSSGFVLDALTSKPAFAQQESGSGQGGGAGEGGGGQGGGGGEGGGGEGGGGGQGGGNDKPGNFSGAEGLTDIGRMNIIKAPDRILNHALYETYNSGADLTWYSFPAEYVATYLDTLDHLLDSPTVNMALLDSYWSDGIIDFTFTPPGDEGTGEVSEVLLSSVESFTDFSAIVIGVAIGKDEIKLYEEDDLGFPLYDGGELVLADDATAIIDTLATIVWGKDTDDWSDEYNAQAIAEAAADVQLKVITVHDAE